MVLVLDLDFCLKGPCLVKLYHDGDCGGGLVVLIVENVGFDFIMSWFLAFHANECMSRVRPSLLRLSFCSFLRTKVLSVIRILIRFFESLDGIWKSGKHIIKEERYTVEKFIFSIFLFRVFSLRQCICACICLDYFWNWSSSLPYLNKVEYLLHVVFGSSCVRLSSFIITLLRRTRGCVLEVTVFEIAVCKNNGIPGVLLGCIHGVLIVDITISSS